MESAAAADCARGAVKQHTEASSHAGRQAGRQGSTEACMAAMDTELSLLHADGAAGGDFQHVLVDMRPVHHNAFTLMNNKIGLLGL